MKTTVKLVHEKNGTEFVYVDVDGLSNVQQMVFVTQQGNTERYNSENYLEDSGWLDGTSYVSTRHSYGDTHAVLAVLENVLGRLDELDLCEDELMDLFFIVFDAGNGKSLLVSNSEELYSYLELEYEDRIVDQVIHISCGSVADDMGIDEVMAAALISHPKTKGFCAEGDPIYDNHTDEETISWNEFVEYYGHLFSDVKQLKKGTEYFDMFKAIKRHISNNPELFDDRGPDMIDTYFERLEYLDNLPDDVHLTYTKGTSNKFYNIHLDNNFVVIEYGAIGKTSNDIDQEFEDREAAKKFMTKKVREKLQSGYIVK